MHTAEAADLKLMVNFAPRWQLPNAQAKDALDRGELGYPVYAYVRMINTLYVPTKMLAWTQKDGASPLAVNARFGSRPLVFWLRTEARLRRLDVRCPQGKGHGCGGSVPLGGI